MTFAAPSLLKPEASGKWGTGQALTRENLLAAWYTNERLTPMAAALAESLANEQAQTDLVLAGRTARLLRRRMEQDGRIVTETMEAEAKAAAVLAVIQWRNGTIQSAPVTGERTPSSLAVVAWRAAVNAMSDDGLGHSLDLDSSGVTDSLLLDVVEPLAVACLSGWESRSDKARRLLRERGATKRKVQLSVRLDRFKGGKAKAGTVERLETACRMMLDGATIEEAALEVGFKARPEKRHHAASDLARVARSLGLKFNLLAHKTSHQFDTDASRYRKTFTLREIPDGQLWAYGLTANQLIDGSIEWN